MIWTAWLLALAGTIFAALCSAADGALLALDRPQARGDVLPRPAAREHRHRALSTARVLGYLAAGAAVAEGAQLAQRSPLGRVSLGLIAALAVVALSEGVARSIGYALAGRADARLRPFVVLVEVLLAPVVVLGARLEAQLNRIMPLPAPDAEDRETSAEQFREVVAAEADVSQAEENLIHGVFSLGDTTVEEVMVPRVDIVGIDAVTPWSEVVDRVRSSEHARFPVYDETIDNVLGILYAKDLLAAVIADEEPADGWRSLIRVASFIPTSKPIDDQLRDFKQSRTHIAIVSDEYGGTAGLVTIEDILEEIVGEINDEYDVPDAEIEREGESRFWVNGSVALDDLRDLLGTDFDHEDVTTVGGLVYALFGRVPRAGDAMVRDGFRIVVERVRRRRIERVYFERLEAVGSRSEP